MTVVALSGANGFLGRHIAKELLKTGCTVRAIMRDSSASVLPTHEKLQVVRCADLFSLDQKSMLALIGDATVLVHAAWYVKPTDYLMSDKSIDCLCGSLRLAQSFSVGGGKRFIGIGSFAEYDLQYRYLKPNTPLAPTTLYSKAKAALSSLLDAYFSPIDISFLWLRLFSVYGEDAESGEQEPRLVPSIHKSLSHGKTALLGSGDAVRDYLEVNAAARQIVELALSSEVGYANICSGQGISVKTLAYRIADMYGRRDLLHFGSQMTRPDEAPYVVGEPHPMFTIEPEEM